MSDTPTTETPDEGQQIQPDAPTTETVGDGPDAPVIPDAPEGAGLFEAPAPGGDIYPSSGHYDPSPGDVAAARGVDAEHDGHTINLGPSEVVDDADAGAQVAAEDFDPDEELADADALEDEEYDEAEDDEVDHDATATVEGDPGVDFPGTAKTI